MKKKIFNLVVISFLLLACQKNELLPTDSQLNTGDVVLNDFDKWVLDSLTKPYNISVKYRWNEWNLSDLGKYNYPTKEEHVDVIMRMMKHTWIDSYVETAGREFIQVNAPREFTIFGGVDLTSNGGPGAWGQASGGVNVLLFDVNGLQYSALESPGTMKSYSGLIHHEFTHILNQNVPFDEAGYLQITPSGYMVQWQQFADWESQMDGFITSYARMNIMEDFAEMVKTIVTNTSKEWDDIISDNYNYYAQQLDMAIDGVAEISIVIQENWNAIEVLQTSLPGFTASLASMPATLSKTDEPALKAYWEILQQFLEVYNGALAKLYIDNLPANEAAEVNSIVNGEALYEPGLLLTLVEKLNGGGMQVIVEANEGLSNPAKEEMGEVYEELNRAKSGRDKLKQKEAFIADYFQKQLGMDLYRLRDRVVHHINTPVLIDGLTNNGATANGKSQADGARLVHHNEVSRSRMMEMIRTCNHQNGLAHGW